MSMITVKEIGTVIRLKINLDGSKALNIEYADDIVYMADDDYNKNLVELAEHLGIPENRLDELIDDFADKILEEANNG